MTWIAASKGSFPQILLMMPRIHAGAPELWGGLECTVNRVHDTYFDQVERTGHQARADDLDRFAELGIRALRYPVLWERTAPEGVARADWSWPDARLARIRELGIEPIVGLLHHGSGPRSTSLLDPAFPDRLADYAAAVARRYPWVRSYTPVNEPLTTARFSGLYGHWYPHAHEPLAFARALLNQVRGVALAMRRIREVSPGAQLVQTEDLGKVFSTPLLAYQAEFENERRWLTYDLLCGRVRRGHPMWSYLRYVGVTSGELEWFERHPCPPDLIGINYYLTSERFLDERREHYPAETHGGNGRRAYADVEAVRVRSQGIAGPSAILTEAWERYRLPLAVTEVHNGCTREEQMRWFLEVWNAASDLRRLGADVRAVTAWALLGAYDWNSLVRIAAGHYEPGVFDLRSPLPRPTALADMLRMLSRGEPARHPVLDAPGWWRRSRRFAYGAGPSRPSIPATGRHLAITGAHGTLGRELVLRCEVRGLQHLATGRGQLDIADPLGVADFLDRVKPWAVVNAAGYVRVDEAEQDLDRCFRENASGPGVLARECRRRGIRLMTFSTDLVFGEGESRHDESSPPSPLNVYGASKLEGERQVTTLHPDALVVRSSAFFGPHDDHNFLTLGLRALANGEPWVAADDWTVSPTYVPDLADAALDLLIDGESGTWHLANQGAVTWAELARRAASLAGYDPNAVAAVPAGALALPARRPSSSVLVSRRGHLLPTLDQALSSYFAQCGKRWLEQSALVAAS